MTANSPKVEPRHLRLQAVVYIRQSTPQQLQNNQEGTRRQYELAQRARQMGWPETAVRVIDDDLGMSGASSQHRVGFQRLVASIGMGEVGIVLVTEVSRLSRLSSDWHRVIELCAVFRTLIADEDGVYDAQNPNDRLLLGVKGTLFAAELHILQARMHGALMNKAQRGELAVALPVGYRRRPDGTVVQDPDDAVRLAITMVFERFAVLGNARAVLRHLAEHGLKLPRVLQAGPEKGQAVWVRPAYGMIHRMLNNPAYAGAFVYGRRRQEVAAGDPPTTTERLLPPEEWAIVVQGVYPAYIGYDAFLSNRLKLRANLYNFAAKGRGAARVGAALLQGLVHCGRCGRQMGVSYGRQQPRYECRQAQTHHAEAMCQSFVSGRIDEVVVGAFLEAVRPAGLDATLAALRGLEQERRGVDRQWQLRLERARYEARLAQRQYDAVDPDNRLVARELERRWEAALAEAEGVQQEYERLRLDGVAALGRRRGGGRAPAGVGPAIVVAGGHHDADGPQAPAPPGCRHRDGDGKGGPDRGGRRGSLERGRQDGTPGGQSWVRFAPAHEGRHAGRHQGPRGPDARPPGCGRAGATGPAQPAWQALDPGPGRVHAAAASHPHGMPGRDPRHQRAGRRVRTRTGGGTAARHHPGRHPGVGPPRRAGLRPKQRGRQALDQA
jgi:DNA invertase Pin-like site-specific DNA recombinase